MRSRSFNIWPYAPRCFSISRQSCAFWALRLFLSLSRASRAACAGLEVLRWGARTASRVSADEVDCEDDGGEDATATWLFAGERLNELDGMSRDDEGVCALRDMVRTVRETTSVDASGRCKVSPDQEARRLPRNQAQPLSVSGLLTLLTASAHFKLSPIFHVEFLHQLKCLNLLYGCIMIDSQAVPVFFSVSASVYTYSQVSQMSLSDLVFLSRRDSVECTDLPTPRPSYQGIH